MKEVEVKEDEINELGADLENTSSRTGSDKPRSSSSGKKKLKKKKKKKKSTKLHQSRSSTPGFIDSEEESPGRAQEEVDFAAEMQVQFRPFDDTTNYEDRPLSRHDRTSSREGKRDEEQLGGEMASAFAPNVQQNNSKSDSSSRNEDGGASPKDSFQHVSLDDVGKNREFYQRHRQEEGEAGDVDTDSYGDDAYEDEFDD